MPIKSDMSPRRRKEVDVSTYEGRFAVRLKMLREKAGMSVEELAESTGIKKSTLYYWESGDYSPNVEQIQLLAESLQTKPRLILPEK